MMEQTGRRIVWIDACGNQGNRLLQYLAAAGIARRVPGAELQNIKLPEWGIERPHPKPTGRIVHSGHDRYWLDAEGLAGCLRRNVMDALVIEGYPYHLEHYPPREICRTMLGPMQGGEDATGFGAHELVCSVRADEILKGIHPGYTPLPPGYYAKLAERTRLDLVFYGQLGEDPYSHSLRAAFPKARFFASRNPGYDFETLRRSKNIALSLSTFAWAAAWLSEAEQIHVPVAGIFNPLQQGNQCFLPARDPNYRFTLLPYSQAVNLFTQPEAFFRQQNSLAATCLEIGAAEVEMICQLATRAKPYGPPIGAFDPEFYITQPGLQNLENPLEHYLRTGWQMGFSPMRLGK